MDAFSHRANDFLGEGATLSGDSDQDGWLSIANDVKQTNFSWALRAPSGNGRVTMQKGSLLRARIWCGGQQEPGAVYSEKLLTRLDLGRRLLLDDPKESSCDAASGSAGAHQR